MLHVSQPERDSSTGKCVMRGVVKGSISQVKPCGVVKGCDQLCKQRRGGGQSQSRGVRL